jgi:hypothetical protein
MAWGKSDQLVVLGGRESRPHGEGTDGDTQPIQETCSGHVGPDHAGKPHWGNSISRNIGIAEASITEEPGAGIPHAGIRAGAAG